MSGMAVCFIRGVILVPKIKQQGGCFINEGERIDVHILSGVRSTGATGAKHPTKFFCPRVITQKIT